MLSESNAHDSVLCTLQTNLAATGTNTPDLLVGTHSGALLWYCVTDTTTTTTTTATTATTATTTTAVEPEFVLQNVRRFGGPIYALLRVECSGMLYLVVQTATCAHLLQADVDAVAYAQRNSLKDES
jgi:hypothetical protein